MTMAGTTAFTLLIAGSTLTGCSNNNSSYNPEPDIPVLKPESDYFDFTTTGNVDFDVNYGKIAAGALLEIYTEVPITYNENGTYVMNGEALFKIFADENGSFKGKVELPTATDKVYVFSPSWGAPICVEAKVENRKVIINTTGNNTVSRATSNTRASDNLTLINVNTTMNLYSIVNWGRYGAIDNTNGLTSIGNIDATTIGQLQKTLWHGATTKPYTLNNQALVSDTKHVNTTIIKSYKNTQGQTVNIIDAELFLTFLTERAGYQTTIGYYYYKTDNVPTTPGNIKKYVIVPNASIEYDGPYDGSTYASSNAPIKKNTKIQLLFQDDNGNLSTKFPAGYTIGYFIIPNAFRPSSSNNTKGTISTSSAFVYSDAEWNEYYGGKKERFISLSTDKGAVIYGVEDGADSSYEDILFSVESTPNEAIQDPGRPVINPEQPEITVTETTYRLYAYEDVWPTGGDYDLNDAIIQHKRDIYVTNLNNYVTKVVDTFTPVQKSDAAIYDDAFAVQYDATQRGKIELPSGAIDEQETSSVIVFDNAMKVRNQPFIITRTFDNKTLTKANLKTDLNPFIIAKYVAGATNRTEVHLPKAKATSKADKKQIGSVDDAYYVDKSGKYPFAMTIPLKIDTPAEKGFIPANETKKIDTNYPDFTKWAESKGTSNSNWYLNYKPIK